MILYSLQYLYIENANNVIEEVQIGFKKIYQKIHFAYNDEIEPSKE